MKLGRRKIIRDLTHNKSRSALVILVIAIGVAAFGMLNTARVILGKDYLASYRATNPAHVVLSVADFEGALVEQVAALEQVAAAEGRRHFYLKVWAEGVWQSVAVQALPGLATAEIGSFRPIAGEPSLSGEGIFFDHQVGVVFPVETGQALRVQSAANEEHTVVVGGLLNDLRLMPTSFNLEALAFMGQETAAELGEPAAFNRLLVVTTAEYGDTERIERLAAEIVQAVEGAGYTVESVEIAPEGTPPLQSISGALLLALQAFGGLILVLTLLLVSNVTTAMMAQQIRQIGILKSMGGESGQIGRLYLQMAVVIGTLALIPALPVGYLGGVGIASLIAGLLDSPILSKALPLSTVVGQVLAVYLVSFLAVYLPVQRAARVTIRAALADDAPEVVSGTVRRSKRRLLLRSAVANAWRKKGRLALTLLMLSLAGAMFMTVFNLRQAIQATLAGEQRRFEHDLGLYLVRPFDTDELIQQTLAVEGVTAAEGWLLGEASVVTEDGRLKNRFQVIAMPVGSEFGRLHVLEGEWPGAGERPIQENRPILLNIEALEQLGLATSSIPLGREMTLKIGTAETEWQVAGSLGRMTAPVAYAGYADFAAASGLEGQANYLAVNLAADSIEQQKEIEQRLVEALATAGFGTLRTSNVAEGKAADADSMDILAISLMIIVVLTGLVGGVGLSGTLSINVMERTREIGILRSMGATRSHLWQLVIVEGLVIGVVSLIPAVLLSLPLSLVMNGGMGLALFGFGLPFAFVPLGLVIWTVLVLLLSLLATLGPARRAGQVTIREAIAYG